MVYLEIKRDDMFNYEQLSLLYIYIIQKVINIIHFSLIINIVPL